MNTKKIIHGIDVALYRPIGDKKYHKDDIGRFLKRFKLYETLRLIGELSRNILINNDANPFIEVHGVPISDSVLAYLAMCVIENSNDYRKNTISFNDISKAADMYYGLPDPFLKDKNIDELFLRFGSAQFDYDREINNILPRSFLIYCHLWDQIEETKNFNINEVM